MIRIYERLKDDAGKLLDEFAEYPIDEFTSDEVDGLAFRNNLLAAASKGNISIWQIDASNNDHSNATNSLCCSFRSEGDIQHLDISPDSKRIAAAFKEKGTVAVFDLESSTLLYEKSGPRDICCARFLSLIHI